MTELTRHEIRRLTGGGEAKEFFCGGGGGGSEFFEGDFAEGELGAGVCSATFRRLTMGRRGITIVID